MPAQHVRLALPERSCKALYQEKREEVDHSVIGVWLVVGIRTIGCTPGRTITNDWRRLMARSTIGNHVTNGSVSPTMATNHTNASSFSTTQVHSGCPCVAEQLVAGKCR